MIWPIRDFGVDRTKAMSTLDHLVWVVMILTFVTSILVLV